MKIKIYGNNTNMGKWKSKSTETIQIWESENQNLRKQYKYGKVKIGTYGNDTNMGKEIDDQVSLDQASSSKVREGKVCRD